MNTFESIKAKLVEKGVEESKITMDTMFSDVDIDSLELVMLITTIEEEMGVELPDENLETMKTIGDAVKSIEEQQK